jgi:hypothetical protein
MFEVLLSVTGEIDPTEFLKRVEVKADATNPEVATLKVWIEGHSASRWFHGGAVRRLANWAPKVMRHSFQAARIDGALASAIKRRARPPKTRASAVKAPASSSRAERAT